MACEWCGQAHPRDQLCASRPKWSRRGFLALFGAGIAGLAVGKLPALVEDEDAFVAFYRMRFEMHVRQPSFTGLLALIDDGTYRRDYFVIVREPGQWEDNDGQVLRRIDGRDDNDA